MSEGGRTRRLVPLVAALPLFLGACAHTPAPAPGKPHLVVDGEAVDTLLVDVVEDNARTGRRRVTIEYDRIGGRGYVTLTDLGREKHREKAIPPEGLERIVSIIDERHLMGAVSDSRGACAGGTGWDVVVRVNRRVHEFFWDSCSGESSGVLRGIFRASGDE